MVLLLSLFLLSLLLPLLYLFSNFWQIFVFEPTHTWHCCVSFLFKRFLFTFSLFFSSATSYSSSVSSVFWEQLFKVRDRHAKRTRQRQIEGECEGSERGREGVSKSAIVCLLSSYFSIGNFSRCDFDLRLVSKSESPRVPTLQVRVCVFCLFLLLAHWICHLWFMFCVSIETYWTVQVYRWYII